MDTDLQCEGDLVWGDGYENNDEEENAVYREVIGDVGVDCDDDDKKEDKEDELSSFFLTLSGEIEWHWKYCKENLSMSMQYSLGIVCQ